MVIPFVVSLTACNTSTLFCKRRIKIR